MMKSSINHNRLSQSPYRQDVDDLDYLEEELASDRRAVLMVVMLAFLFGLVLGVVSSSLYAGEMTQAGIGEKTEKSKDSQPKVDWKPPVAKPAVAPLPIDSKIRDKIKEEKGVEILSLQLTAAGYMMDFRFRVVDVKKSKIFFDQKIKPLVHVNKSNAKLPVPMAAKVGAFRMTDRGKNVKENKTYYIVFANPDTHVKSGDKVTMIFGDYKIENMTVN